MIGMENERFLRILKSAEGTVFSESVEIFLENYQDIKNAGFASDELGYLEYIAEYALYFTSTPNTELEDYDVFISVERLLINKNEDFTFTNGKKFPKY